MRLINRVLNCVPLLLAAGLPLLAEPTYKLPPSAKSFRRLDLIEELGAPMSNFIDLRTGSIESGPTLRVLADRIMTKHFGRRSQNRTVVHFVRWELKGNNREIAADQVYLLEGSRFWILHDFGTTKVGSRFRTSWDSIDFLALHSGLPASAFDGSFAYTFGGGDSLGESRVKSNSAKPGDDFEQIVPLAWMARPNLDVYTGERLFTFELRQRPSAETGIERWPVAAQHIQFFERSERTPEIAVGIPYHSLHRTRVRDGQIVDDNIFRPLLFVSIPFPNRRVQGFKRFEPFVAIPLASKPLSQPIVGLSWGGIHAGVSLNRIHTPGATPGTFDRQLRPQFFIGTAFSLTRAFERAERRRKNAAQ